MRFALNSFCKPIFTLIVPIFLAITTLAQVPPSGLACRVRPWYKHRPDGKAGREVTLLFKGKLFGAAVIKVDAGSIKEETHINNLNGIDSLALLLPEGIGVKQDCEVRIAVIGPKVELYQALMVLAQRQWTVYIYPHSHVDIGYTNTQEFVRKLHTRNIDVAIDIARKTQNNPEGSRFVWNPEANWVTENYLKEASPEKKKIFIEAVKKGWISLDGDYGNINTSATSDEELLQLFHQSKSIQKLTGVPIKTMVQMDVAGVSWGTAQAAYQNGIHGFFLYPNIGTIRRPWEHRPFYWIAPDGKSKIFFLQALPYGFGYNIKGSKIGLGKVQGRGGDIDCITTKDPTANFIDPLIFDETRQLELNNSPYNIFVMPWALADNALIDADLPEAVRLWNQKYAYPKVIISGSQRIMDDFEKRYSNIIPNVKGDYSEYWTDGLGSDTRRVGLYRQATENIVQAETAWCMLNYGKASPRALVDTAWENALLGAEHTWGYQDPKAALAKQIEATKAGYFENSYKNSRQLLNETFKPVQKKGSSKIAVFNTLSWERSGLITLDKEQSIAGNRLLDDKGNAVISQRLSTGELAFWVDKIPALGSRTYTVVNGEPARFAGTLVNGNVLSNWAYSVTIDQKTGDISSLKDLKTGYEYVDSKSEYALNSYRYLLGPDSVDKASKPYDVKLKVKENGPLAVSISVESAANGVNWLTREVRIIKGQPWVDMIDAFDKISTQNKEGINIGFAFNIPGGTTRLDIPWGVMQPEADQLVGANKSWLTFQHWVDVSNKTNGVTWTCIESPLIELGKIFANLRGGAHGSQNWYKHFTDTQPLFSWPLNNHWGTNFPLEQGGVITLHYGIMPHGAYNAATASRFGLEENRPLLAVPVDKAPGTKSWISIGNPNVLISILKQSDDGKGMILRLRSVSNKPEKVLLSWPNGKPRKLYSCLADEKLEQEIHTDQTILPLGTITYYFEM
ncbi:MAG: glycoside hydrolase family 38 C-terminal domain-containing protein [Bacteroidota bacterium]